MKKSLLFLSAAAFLAACGSSAPEQTVETTDAQVVQEVAEAANVPAMTEASTISWVGFKTYDDGRHNGTVAIKNGEFQINGEELVGGSFTIDMNTIACLDLPDAEYNGKLVGHLKSDDFFAVETNPEAKFEIVSVTANNPADTTASHTVTGNLTLRGVTKAITVPANIKVSNGHVQVTTPEFAIDRKQWNVMYGSTGIEGLAKDKLIDDNILLSLNING
ncbi:MAG: YceI family protein [Flavobacteriales bacterium]